MAENAKREIVPKKFIRGIIVPLGDANRRKQKNVLQADDKAEFIIASINANFRVFQRLLSRFFLSHKRLSRPGIQLDLISNYKHQIFFSFICPLNWNLRRSLLLSLAFQLDTGAREIFKIALVSDCISNTSRSN